MNNIKDLRYFPTQFADDLSRGEFGETYHTKATDAKSKWQVENLYYAARKAGIRINIENIYSDPQAYYRIKAMIMQKTGLTSAEADFYMFGS